MVRLPDCPLLDPDEHRSRHCAGTPAVGPSHVEEYPFIQLYDLNRQYQGPRSFFRLFFSPELSLSVSLSRSPSLSLPASTERGIYQPRVSVGFSELKILNVGFPGSSGFYGLRVLASGLQGLIMISGLGFWDVGFSCGPFGCGDLGHATPLESLYRLCRGVGLSTGLGLLSMLQRCRLRL